MPLNNQRCLGTTKLLSDSFSKDSASSSHNAVLDNMYMPPLCCCPAEKPQNLLFKNKYGMSTLTFHGVSWLTQTFKSAHDFIVWVHTCLRRLVCLEESGKSLIFQVCTSKHVHKIFPSSQFITTHCWAISSFTIFTFVLVL